MALSRYLRAASAALFCTVWMCAIPASAHGQVAERGAVDEILVVGSKQTPEEARRAAADFVRATGVATGQQPAARWTHPICPRVFGIPAAHAARVEARIRAVATEIGAPLAAAPCRPNLAISFAADAGGLVRRVAARAPDRFREVAADDRERLLRGTAPVRWWYSSEDRTKDGIAGVPMPLPSVSTGEGGASPIPGTAGSGSYLHYRSSIVSTQMIRAIRSATVVVDVNRAAGVPLNSVADFAAMVSLAEMRLNAPAVPGSILGLFAHKSPAELSERDEAFLRGLYRLPLDRLARQHRGKLVRSMLATKDEGR